MHIRVLSGSGESTFWREPTIEIVKNHGHNLAQLREIEKLIEEHHPEFIDAWRHHFGC